jgi:hypothetical protein
MAVALALPRSVTTATLPHESLKNGAERQPHARTLARAGSGVAVSPSS